MVRRYGGRFADGLCGRILVRYVFGAVDMDYINLTTTLCEIVVALLLGACFWEISKMGGDDDD